jgi:hypothetical protein
LNDDGTHPEDTPTTPAPTFTVAELEEAAESLASYAAFIEAEHPKSAERYRRKSAMLEFAASLVRQVDEAVAHIDFAVARSGVHSRRDAMLEIRAYLKPTEAP